METININLAKDNKEKIYYQEFFLFKDNHIYKIIIGKKEAKISISSGNYHNEYNLEEISSLFINKFCSLDNAFNYLIDLFEDNKATINNKIKYKEIIIYFYLINEKKIELKLNYDKKYQTNFIINNIKDLQEEIKTLKLKNNKLEEELKTIKQNMVYKQKPPTNLRLLYSLKEKGYADYGLDNTFVVFNSFNNILYLVYSTIKKSIICYDLRNNA